jgi:hypothetical protein
VFFNFKSQFVPMLEVGSLDHCVLSYDVVLGLDPSRFLFEFVLRKTPQQNPSLLGFLMCDLIYVLFGFIVYQNTSLPPPPPANFLSNLISFWAFLLARHCRPCEQHCRTLGRHFRSDFLVTLTLIFSRS